MNSIQSARRRITSTLFLAYSLFSAAMIISFTVLPILAARLSGQDSAAGLPSTLSLVGRAAAAYPIGWLMDRIGRRWGLSLGYGIGAAGMAVMAWAVLLGSFGWFMVGVTLFGMGRGAAELGRYVAAEVQPVENRAKSIGLVVFAGTIGSVVGPLLVAPSSQLAARFDLLADSGPFWLGTVFMVIGLFLLWARLRPDPQTMIVVEEVDGKLAAPSDTPLWRLFADSRVLLALSSMAIGQMVMVLIMVITPLYMDHQHQSTQAISLVVMTHTLGMFGLSWLTGGLIDKFGRITIMFVGAFILLVSAIMTPLVSGVPLLAAALFLLGLGWNFCFVAGSSLLTDSIAAGDKGRVQGAAEVIVALSSGAGSLSSGPVFAGGGMIAIGGVGLAMVLLLLAGGAWFNWSRRAALAVR